MIAYLKAIFETIGNFYDSLKELLLNLLSAFFSFLEAALLYIPQKIYALLTDLAFYIFDVCGTCGVLYIHQTIKAAIDSFHYSLGSVGSIPNFNFFDCVSYLANSLGLNAGFQLIVCAYILRFIIRRLPVVG